MGEGGRKAVPGEWMLRPSHANALPGTLTPRGPPSSLLLHNTTSIEPHVWLLLWLWLGTSRPKYWCCVGRNVKSYS